MTQWPDDSITRFLVHFHFPPRLGEPFAEDFFGGLAFGGVAAQGVGALFFSQENVAYQPWDYTQDSMQTDVELQKKLYEGFFKAWWGNPRLGGFSVWEW